MITKGKIIQIKDYQIQLPDVPTNSSEILFTKELHKNQFWRRIEYSKHFHEYNPQVTTPFAKETYYDNNTGALLALNEVDSLKVQKELQTENYRRRYGVYAMINGALTHIAPDYYYNLQWCQMKDLPEKYGRFRRVQNEFLTVWDWAKYQEWITLVVLAKCKKSGATQIISGAVLNEASLYPGWELGMVSKEYDHVRDVALAYVFHAFDNLPMIMQPTVKKRNLHELVFGKPIDSVRSKAGKSTESFLNTRIFGAKTKPSCFDGPVMKRAIADELPKWWEASKVSPAKAHKKMIETVKLQQKKNGLLLYMSYLPEVDDLGFIEYKKIYQDSKVSKKSAVTGQTPTGGIAYPMTAEESNEDCFDIYGECDRRKAHTLVMNERDTKTNIGDKQAHRRQYPLDETDMFDSGGKGTTFNNIRLANQLRDVEEELNTGVAPYKLGDLRWENSVWEDGDKEHRRPHGKFGKVYFEELSEEDQIIKPETASMKSFFEVPNSFLNKAFIEDSRDYDDDALKPFDDTLVVGAFDPTDYAVKQDVAEGSKNAGHFGFIFDPTLQAKRIRTDEIWLEYYFRREDPDDTLEDLVKLIIYTGARVIIEANKKWLVTAIKKEGLHHFLLLKQKDGSIAPYKEGDENDLVNTTTDMINAYCRAINRWWKEPKHPNDPDKLKTVKSKDLLNHGLNFDVTNTKKFDLIVSLGYWRLAVEALIVWLEEREKENSGGDDALEHAMNTLIY